MNTVFNVIVKVGYHSTYFKFTDGEKACEFAKTALEHLVGSDDEDRQPYLTIQVNNIEPESEVE